MVCLVIIRPGARCRYMKKNIIIDTSKKISNRHPIHRQGDSKNYVRGFSKY